MWRQLTIFCWDLLLAVALVCFNNKCVFEGFAPSIILSVAVWRQSLSFIPIKITITAGDIYVDPKSYYGEIYVNETNDQNEDEFKHVVTI